jgi:hypothetical protein
MQLSVFGDSETDQFLRNVSTPREFFKAGTCIFDFRKNPVSGLDVVAAGDEAIEVFDVSFGVLGEKNTI